MSRENAKDMYTGMFTKSFFYMSSELLSQQFDSTQHGGQRASIIKAGCMSLLLQLNIQEYAVKYKYPNLYHLFQEQKEVGADTLLQIKFAILDVLHIIKNIRTAYHNPETCSIQLGNAAEAVVNGSKLGILFVIAHGPMAYIHPGLALFPGLTPTLYIAAYSLGKYNPFKFKFTTLHARKNLPHGSSQPSPPSTMEISNEE